MFTFRSPPASRATSPTHPPGNETSPSPPDSGAVTEKPKQKSKTKVAKQEPLPLPIRATAISDTPSFESTVFALADCIKNCLSIETAKSVTAPNRDLAIRAAAEICVALEAHKRFTSSLNSTPAPATDASSLDVLKKDIKGLGEEIAKLSKNINTTAQKHIEVPAPSPPSDLLLQEINKIFDDKFDKVRKDFDEKFTSISKENKHHTELAAEKITKTYATIAAKQQKTKSTPGPAANPPTATRFVEATLPTTRPALVVAFRSKPNNNNPQEIVTAFKEAACFKTRKYNPARVVPVKDKLRVEFDTEKERDDVLELINSNSHSKVKAEVANRLKPMVILKGISKDVADEELVSTILMQNPELGKFAHNNTNKHLELKFKRNNRNDALYNAVLMTTPDAFRALIAMGRVRVDIQRVHVEEHSPFLQCRKCLQFGHTLKNCKNPSTRCAHCAEEGHLAHDCTSKGSSPKCFNCDRHNTRFPDNKHPTQHTSTSHTCPIVRAMRNKTSNNIDYGSAQ